MNPLEGLQGLASSIGVLSLSTLVERIGTMVVFTLSIPIPIPVILAYGGHDVVTLSYPPSSPWAPVAAE